MFQDYNDFGYKQALAEFDQAVAHRYSTIVIEPASLGTVTHRWIRLGILLRRLSFVSGLGACGLLIASAESTNCFYASLPFAAVSLTAFTIHSIEWLPDPCSQYKIVDDKNQISELEMNNSNSALVLRHTTESTTRQIVHYTVVGMTCFLLTYRLLTKADHACCSSY